MTNSILKLFNLLLNRIVKIFSSGALIRASSGGTGNNNSANEGIQSSIALTAEKENQLRDVDTLRKIGVEDNFVFS